MIKHDIRTLDKSGRLHWYHWLVVVSSLMLTFTAWYVTSHQANQKSQLQFDFQAGQLTQLVKERMGKYEDALWSGVAAHQAQSNDIDVNKWKAFSSALSIEDKYPGINSIGVIYYVPPEKLADYLAKERQLRPKYQIHPPHQQPEFWPITYIEPVSTNRKAVGLDMAHENNRFTAAKKARDTGSAQITGPIVLVQDAKKTPGFLFYAPFYHGLSASPSVAERQQQFIGVVYAPFIMEKLMLGTLQNKNRLVNFSISDGGSQLYDEFHLGSEDYDPNPLFTKYVEVDMYGRQWNFELSSTLLFRQQQTNHQPTVILIGGIIIDTMLLALFWALSVANKRAIHLANEITQDLQNSEAKLNATIEHMMDGLLTIDNQGQIQSFNGAAERIFGYRDKDIIGRNIDILFNSWGENKGDLFEQNILDPGELMIGKRKVIRASKKDGDEITIELAP